MGTEGWKGTGYFVDTGQCWRGTGYYQLDMMGTGMFAGWGTSEKNIWMCVVLGGYIFTQEFSFHCHFFYILEPFVGFRSELNLKDFMQISIFCEGKSLTQHKIQLVLFF